MKGLGHHTQQEASLIFHILSPNSPPNFIESESPVVQAGLHSLLTDHNLEFLIRGLNLGSVCLVSVTLGFGQAN